jgi:hypothetical protein
MNGRIVVAGLVAALVSVIGSNAALADRKMVVLIDASGSMSTVRTDGFTRFETAKARAKSKIAEQKAIDATTTFSVYTFSDVSSTPQTAGFVTATTANTAIDGLDLLTVGGGITPLAGSVCDAVDVLVATGATTKVLQLASDGEENSTPATNICAGPFSTDPSPPYSGGSWQNKVLNYAGDNGINVQIELFDPGPIVTLAARAAAARDPEAQLTARTKLITAIAAAAVGEGPPTLAEFFAELARETGGRLTIIDDQVPQLPVFADLNGNSCVDRSDALLVARAFGQTGAPQDHPLDLDSDGKVGFSDYALALASFTPGGCGTADPYVARAPLVCSGLQPVVISGQTIASGAITIDARVACQVIIKNSLIVSGTNAIKVLGTAAITIDNSILVGETAVLNSQGATVLSAANTVFHGKRSILGAFAFLDRGGNVWE